MLNVAMLIVIILSAILLNVIILSVVMLNIIIQIVIMLIAMLSVMAPTFGYWQEGTLGKTLLFKVQTF